MERLTIIDAPSSAGAYSPGQERAPQALRDAGLVEALRRAGVDSEDGGVVAPFRWRPDREHPRAQNLPYVAAAATETARLVAAVPEDRIVLVLGGDCTVGVGTVAGATVPGATTGLVYFDLHADLNVPASVVDGALDWMGVAHLLGEEGAAAELADIGEIDPGRLVLFGLDPAFATDFELAAIERRGIEVVEVEAVAAAHEAAARRALDHLAGCDRLLVHFDVDVIDFLDTPLAENIERQGGLTLRAAMRALAVLVEDEAFRALTVTELNPDHGAADGSTLAAFCDGLAGALGQREVL